MTRSGDETQGSCECECGGEWDETGRAVVKDRRGPGGLRVQLREGATGSWEEGVRLHCTAGERMR